MVSPAPIDSSRASTKKILIVDDEFDSRDVLSILFGGSGFQTATANNGLDALSQVRRAIPDLIISDCQMPLMDGPALCRILKQSEATAAIPIILMSGAPERHHLATANYDVFLRKPIGFATLLEAVVRLIGR